MSDGKEEEMLIWDNVSCAEYIVEFDVMTDRVLPDAPELSYYTITAITDTDGNEISGDLYNRIEDIFNNAIK